MMTRRGLRTSVVGNATAFGFSIMITASFGVLSRTEGSPTVGEVYGFAVMAVLGFVLLEAVASKGFRRRPETYPVEVKLLGTALGALPVTAGVSAALAAGEVFTGDLGAWLVGPAAAAAAFTLAEAITLSLAAPVEQRWVTEGEQNDPGA